MTSPILTFYILLTTFLIYLMQDGKALMLCSLAPFCKQKYHLKIFNDILPSWDANQTWLVFTIAGTYGAFPTFFGETMSKHYTFFFITLMLFILRGASIEFYVKSSKFKNIWLYILSFSSFLLLVSQVGFCTILIASKASIYLALLPFIIWFHFSQACYFLFSIKNIHRLGYVFGLLVSSQLLFILLKISVWKILLTSHIFTIHLTLIFGLIIFSIFNIVSKFFDKILLFYIFFSNAFFILKAENFISTLPSLYQIIENSTYSPFLIINFFSIIFLPSIAIGLSKMKKIFMSNLDEMVY